MNLFCVGISHHTANVETRERYARSRNVEAALREKGCAEALLLSTCNRVEVYGVAERFVESETVAAHLLPDSPAQTSDDAASFYRHEADECVQHLFRVRAVWTRWWSARRRCLDRRSRRTRRRAISVARGRSCTGLFQRAFRVAKQVRTNTDITRGAVSVGSVAVELAGKIFGELKHRKVLVLGAGDTSERTARSLASRGVTDLRVTNRSGERAEHLAR
jgi:glutamyl-tRNA reductase